MAVSALTGHTSVMEATNWIWPVGSVGFLVDFDFYMAVWGVRRGPIGFVAPWRFKILDSQPEKSNMGPFPIDFDDF